MSDPYAPFSKLYVVPGLAGRDGAPAWGTAWRTPVLDRGEGVPVGYDGLRGDDAQTPTVATPGAVASGPQPESSGSALWPIVGGLVIGYLLGRVWK